MTDSLSKASSRTLRVLLEENALRYGAAAAVLHDGERISHARLWEDVAALSAALSTRLAPESHVLLVGGGYPFLISFLALTAGAGVAVPADTAISAEALAALAGKVDATAVLYAPEAAERVAGLSVPTRLSLAELPRLVEEGRAALLAGAPAIQPRTLDADDVAAIFDTAAGSVPLSHRNLLTVLTDVARMQRLTCADRALSVLPLSRIESLLLGVLLPLMKGVPVAFAERANRLLCAMRETRPTYMAVTPLLARAILKKYRETVSKNGLEGEVRRIIALTDPIRPVSAGTIAKRRLLAATYRPFGGAAQLLVVGGILDPETKKRLAKIGMPARQAYGAVECAGLMALDGLCLPSGTLEICDPQPDGSGEVRYKGDNVASGYCNSDVAVLQNGWFYPGDMGRMGETDRLRLIGRRENALRLNADTLVCPEELEALLCESPLVREAAVVALPTEADGCFELAAVLAVDAAELQELDATERLMEEWVCHINGDLPAYKQVALFTLRAAPLCRNPQGALDRAALTRELTQQ